MVSVSRTVSLMVTANSLRRIVWVTTAASEVGSGMLVLGLWGCLSNMLLGGEVAGQRLGSADGWVVSPCWVAAQCGSASEDLLERCGGFEAG